MHDYLAELGIRTYINAHDTVTLYGASRMRETTLAAMNQMAGVFAHVDEVQTAVGDRIAALTHNEAAYVANCAAGALQLCAAVCIAGEDEWAYRRLPQTDGRREIIILHSQYHCYTKAVESAGASVTLVGDADEVLPFDLAGSISKQTAAVLYTPHINYDRASLPLQDVVNIAHSRDVPVIVDAAAYLPPVENLWRYTQEGADLAVFSGGKTLRGPQTSGLIVGRKELINLCRRYGAPQHGICRSSKASKEAMIGLYAAIESFLEEDPEKEKARMTAMVDRLCGAMSSSPLFRPYRVEHGSVGQDYPRAFAEIEAPATSGQIQKAMRERGIFIGTAGARDIYISPLSLTEHECAVVCQALQSLTVLDLS